MAVAAPYAEVAAAVPRLQELAQDAGDLNRPADTMVTVDLNELRGVGLAQMHTVTGAVMPAQIVRVVPTTFRGRARERLAGLCVLLRQKVCPWCTPLQLTVGITQMLMGGCIGYIVTVLSYECIRTGD